MRLDLDSAWGFARISGNLKTALDDLGQRNLGESNRCNNCPANESVIPVVTQSGWAGVDRIKIGIPFDRYLSDWRGFLTWIKKSKLGEYGRTAKTIDPDTGITLDFFVWPGSTSHVIYLEFNPSRYRDPSGYSLLHPDEVVGVVEEIIRIYFSNRFLIVPTFMVNEHGEEDMLNWNPLWKEEITLSRLDASRDFYISDPTFSPILLGKIQAKRSHGTYLSLNHGDDHGWSNILKSQDGRLNFYDKAAQTRAVGVNPQAPKGTFRFEYRMENRHLRTNHLHRLGHLTAHRFESALNNGWDLSGLSKPFVQQGAWKDFIRGSSLPVREKLELIGFLEEDALGQDEYFSTSYRKSMRLKARALGISFRRSLEEQSIKKMRLDLLSGDLVTE